jgi:hypothetical protein
MPNDRIDVLVVPAEGPCRIEEIEPTLDEFQRLVGGPIEFLHVAPGVACYLDEEGRIRTPPKLVNARATSLYDLERMVQRKPTLDKPMLGDVVFFGVDGSEDEKSVPKLFASRAITADQFVKIMQPAGRKPDFTHHRKIEENALAMGLFEALELDKRDPKVRPEENN